MDKEKLFPLADGTRMRRHRYKVLEQRCRGGCEEEYFDAVNGNDLELAADKGGGSGDNKQLQRKLDGHLGEFQTERLTKYLLTS